MYMFSGIVAQSCTIHSISRSDDFMELGVTLPPELIEGLALGASVSVDGVCLTVTSIIGTDVFFDVMQETLKVTTLKDLNVDDMVNIERSLQEGGEIGGHHVSGHVDTLGMIVDKSNQGQNCTVTISLPHQWLKYIFKKGYIAVDGVSLTVGKVDREKNQFEVYLIPETLSRTSLGRKQPQQKVNLEIERSTQVIVDTVERYLSTLQSQLLNEGRQEQITTKLTKGVANLMEPNE